MYSLDQRIINSAHPIGLALNTDNLIMPICLLVIFQVILALVCCQQFKMLSYTDIIARWRNYTVEYPHLKQWDLEKLFPQMILPNNTDCHGKCPYLLFEHTSPQTRDDSPTVLLVSAFHGNQTISAQILTHAYRYLKGHHILFIPLVNPSGYSHSVRTEFPSMIDPNRDFPYDTDYDMCMKGAASRIMDMVYRKWKIDLTITVHQGGDEIAWAWGAPSRNGLAAKDKDIYEVWGKAMREAGGSNTRIGMKTIKTGDMNTLIYPAKGSFEDWAYAASWDHQEFHPSAVTKCKAYRYASYNPDMNRGLVFIFESSSILYIPESMYGSSQGIYQSPTSNDSANGFVSRGIRVLQAALNITYPIAISHQENNTLELGVSGCQAARLNIIYRNNRLLKFSVNGSLSNSPNNSLFDLRLADPNSTGTANISYEIVCDTNWKAKGRSLFAKGRVFKGSLSLQTTKFNIEDKLIQENKIEHSQSVVKDIVIALSFMIGLLSLYLVAKIILDRDRYRTIIDNKPNTTLDDSQSREQFSAGIIMRPEDLS